jgi:predicted Zn-dependent protease
MLLKLDRYDEAEKASLAAITKFPDDPWLHARLATIYSAIINLPKAIETINKARTLKPGDDEIEQRYADILTKQGEYEEALSILQPMLSRDEPAFGAVMNFSQFAAEIDKKDELELLLKKLNESDDLTSVQHDSITRALVQLSMQ